MTRTALRQELIGLVVLSSGSGLLTAHAVGRTAFFAPDEPWRVYALGGNFMFVSIIGVVGRRRRILAHAEAREASTTRPIA